MSAKLHNAVANKLIDGLIDTVPALKRKGDKNFLKYDRIVVNLVTGKVEFGYKGDAIFFMETSPMTNVNTVTIEGLQGKMPFDLELA